MLKKSLFFVFMFFAITACKKERTIRITATNVATLERIPYLHYYIVQLTEGLNGEKATTVGEGKTDQNGKANIIFKPKKNSKYSYMIYFDYSEVVLPAGAWSFINPPSYRNVTKEFMSVHNTYEIRALPKMQVQTNFKNLNCFNAEDTFRYKKINTDENPNDFFSESTPWLEGASLNGCVNFTGPYLERLGGHYIFKWEAIRGGQMTSGIDTFFVSPGVNDQINMFW